MQLLLAAPLLLLLLQGSPSHALDNGLGRTPPQGFNPWNCFGISRTGTCKLVNPALPPPGCHGFNESVILAVADAMVSSGLADAGYTHVNLDCGWTTGYRHETTHELIVNTDKFPHGLRWLGDRIHEKGLKFGIYLSASKAQCCSHGYNNANDGSDGFEQQDARLIASYGVDYLKYDDCDQVNQSYYAMRDALNSTGRPIFYSIHGLQGAVAVDVANAWRTTHDVNNTFESVLERAMLNDAFASFSGPGSFAMPDMLEVGNFYNNNNAGLSNAESRSMMSMWAVMKAPLLIGTDVTLPRNRDDQTIKILSNPEVLAIDQDPSGRSARLVAGTPDGTTVYAGTLSGSGTQRVLSLTNSGNVTAVNISVDLDAVLGKPGWAWKARDVWRRADYVHKIVSGKTTFGLVEHHDTLLLTLTGLPPP
jgi:alpha-galactosidase